MIPEARADILDFYSLSAGERMNAVAQINESIGEPWTQHTETIRANYNETELETTLFKMARVAGEFIGYVLARPDTEDPVAYHISFLAVRKVSQCRNYGRRLFACIVERVKELGKTKITLFCRGHLVRYYMTLAHENDFGMQCNLTDNPYPDGALRYSFIYSLLPLDRSPEQPE